jgi:hypothetical protein
MLSGKYVSGFIARQALHRGPQSDSILSRRWRSVLLMIFVCEKHTLTGGHYSGRT